MYGPDIFARTLSVPTRGTGAKEYAYGNSWQYHSRSDRHSKVICWGLAFDLLLNCSLLRNHVAMGRVGLGINHEMRDFRNSKKKNLDLVISTSPNSPSRGGSKGGTRGARDFSSLVEAYGIQLVAEERTKLAELPTFPIAGVANVLVAVEAKAAMTAFLKARPRLKDELTSSYQTIHGDNQHAIAAGVVIVNAASTFISPDMNKWNLAAHPPHVSEHRQPRDAQKVVDGLGDLQRRASTSDAGFDALGVLVVKCRNDGSPVTVVLTHPPAPARTDDFDYARFVRRLAHLYETRFSGI